MNLSKFALVDVETTGGSPITDRVIDIGIVLVDDFKVVHEWQSLINPECSISPFITTITSITDIDVLDAPRFVDVSTILSDLLKERIFIAHNVRFDYSFIRNEFRRININFKASQVCTVKLSRHLYPEFTKHNLDTIIERLRLNVEHRHRALPDAKVLFSFIQHSIEDKGLDTFMDTLTSISKHPALPSNVNADVMMKLPNTTGVYSFYTTDGVPLYIGKSLHIRDRVLEHFYNDTDSPKELEINMQTKDIDYRLCAGELDALLTESKLIKEIKPIYNKQLRENKKSWIGKLEIDSNGYLKIHFEDVDQLYYEDKKDIAVYARSKSQLHKLINKLCIQYELCPKLCGIESVSHECFSYHLGKCWGACCGKESVDSYNLRVTQAFLTTKIPDWTFETPIMIHEYNESQDLHKYFVINNWAIINTTNTFSMDYSVHIPDLHAFSHDEYVILKRYISKYGTSRIIKIPPSQVY